MDGNRSSCVSGSKILNNMKAAVAVQGAGKLTVAGAEWRALAGRRPPWTNVTVALSLDDST